MNTPGLVKEQMTGRLRKCKEEESKSEVVHDAVSQDTPSCYMTLTAVHFALIKKVMKMTKRNDIWDHRTKWKNGSNKTL